MLKPLPKLLLVFNLEGPLCHINKRQVSTISEDVSQESLIIRPQIDSLLRFLFVRNKLFFKVGIWSSSSVELTDQLCKKLFSGYERNILFKYASPNQLEARDLNRIWYNYPDFTLHNTAYIDATLDSVIQQDNLLLMPLFEKDDCLNLLKDYIQFFSYQYQFRKMNTFQEFMRSVPFSLYCQEHSKKYIEPPKGEASRFY